MVNIACHIKQSSKTTSFGGTLAWQWSSGTSSVRVVLTATTRILRHRFPGTCETVGQVFKFVWRLHWKINAVCMSLSPFVSFQSRFVTYLLTFLRIYQCQNFSTLLQNVFHCTNRQLFLAHTVWSLPCPFKCDIICQWQSQNWQLQRQIKQTGIHAATRLHQYFLVKHLSEK